MPLPKGFSVALHAGQQKFEGAGNDDLFGYEDYKAGVSYGFAGGWTAGVAYTHTNAKDASYTVLGKNGFGEIWIRHRVCLSCGVESHPLSSMVPVSAMDR